MQINILKINPNIWMATRLSIFLLAYTYLCLYLFQFFQMLLKLMEKNEKKNFMIITNFIIIEDSKIVLNI